MPNAPEPLAYSIADACRVTSIGKTRIYELLALGTLRSVKVGKRTLIPAKSLKALVAAEAD